MYGGPSESYSGLTFCSLRSVSLNRGRSFCLLFCTNYEEANIYWNKRSKCTCLQLVTWKFIEIVYHHKRLRTKPSVLYGEIVGHFLNENPVGNVFSFKLMVRGQWSVGRLDGHFLQARHRMYPLNHASNTLTASVPTILCFILPWRCREEEGWSLESRMFLLWMYNSIRVLIFGWVKHK